MTERPNMSNTRNPGNAPSKTRGPETEPREGAPDPTADISERAQALASDVKHAADDVAGQVRGAAEKRLEGGKDRVGRGLEDLAEALRKTASNLRGGEEASLTDYVSRAADRVEAASDYFERRSFGEMVGDIEQFARREPAVFLGGAFGVGVLVGRFLRSSRRARSAATRRDGESASPQRALPSGSPKPPRDV